LEFVEPADANLKSSISNRKQGASPDPTNVWQF